MDYKFKNILLTCDRLDSYGGLERYVTDMVVYFANLGFKVFLDCNAINKEFKEKVSHKNIILNSPWNKKEIIDVIGDFKPDVISAHPFSAIHRAYRYIKASGTKAPLFYTLHGKNQCGVGRNILNDCNLIAVNSKTVQGFTMNKEYRIIENGIDISKFELLPERKKDSKIIITNICRLADGKEWGVFRFVESLKILQSLNRELFDKMVFNILGGGIKYNEMVNKVNELPDDIKNKIILEGNINNVKDYIEESDLIFGHGRVALESLSSGRNIFYIGLARHGAIKGIVTRENHYDYLFTDNCQLDISNDTFASMILETIMSKNKYNLDLYNFIRKEYCMENKFNKILKYFDDIVRSG